MPGHDLIVVGGSAGSVEALTALVSGLPADLPAAVCVVVHQPSYFPSRLPEILARYAPLPVVPAVDGAPLLPGVVHVSIPDQHLMVRRGPDGAAVLRLTRGPRENRTRPAVDPLFRSAALVYGPRTVAVVLSGALDDGTAGAWAVRDRGGLVVVQDPEDALVASMPASVLREVGADHVAPAAELGELLGRLARLPAGAHPHAAGDAATADLEREVAVAELDDDAHAASERYGAPSRFACPECGGVLWDTRGNGGGPLRFRCDTGHAYSPATLAEVQTEAVEAALAAALRTLENKAELARARAEGARARGLEDDARRYQVQWEAAQQYAATVRALMRLDGRSGMSQGEG